jgi:putative alpha-1,2-mannosidase
MKKVFFIVSMFLFTSLLYAQKGIDYVDVFIGTADDFGQNDPAATVPYGMVKVSPDTDPRNHGGYNYENTQLMGFSVNRLNGTGCSGAGGNLRILPRTDNNPYVFLHKGTEKATPGFYTVELSNGIRVELTATNNMAIERYYFGNNRSFSLELNHRSSFSRLLKSEYKQLSSTSLSGECQAMNNCNFGRYIQYYYLNSSQPFTFVAGENLTMKFTKENSDFVEIRIALSGMDEKTAMKELELQSGLTFDEVKATAHKLWDEKLSKIEVKGSDEDKTMFYTSLYRNFLSPVNVTTHENTYRDSEGIVQKADGFTYMGFWSLWDTYRTKFPLMSLVDAVQYKDVCRSLVELYRSGKYRDASEYEMTPSCRTEHSVIILLDALRKNIGGFDLKTVYAQLEKEATELPMQSPDNFMESAYDLWALAQISKDLKMPKKYEYYKAKADSAWRTKWIEKFRDIKDETFDIMHGDGMYEGTLWQYRWAAPFAIDEMAELAGGKEILAGQLDYFFSNNLYNHGNQPDIQAPFMFNHMGRPDLSQKWVNTILTQPMTHCYGTHEKFKVPFVGKAYRPIPRAYIPEMDDDDGTMSAWYVWASIGLYPLVIGEPFYEITNPLFEEISLKLDNGKTFTIRNKATKNPDSKIQKVLLNGKEIKDFRIYHQDICKGGLLEIL